MTGHTGLFVAPVPGTTTGAVAADARAALAGLLAKNADGTVRVGVLADGQGPVVTGTAGMSYSIRKHVAVTKVSEANGPVLVPNDGPLLVATDPAPGSNSRIDVIWVRQPHATGDGGSATTVTPEYGVAKGATGAPPPKPGIGAGPGLVPSDATELASVTVTAGTTATSGLTFTQGQTTTANIGGYTDWTQLTLPAGFTSPTGIWYCVEGRTVYLSGVVVRSVAWAAQSYALFPSLPPLIRPAFDVNLPAAMDANGSARIAIETGGALTLIHYAGAPGFISLSAQWIRKV